MKAVVVHAPTQYSIEEVPDPVPPEGGLLVMVKACGLCGSDLRTLQWGHRKIHLPWIIGHEVCGVILETGIGYHGTWRVGQSICLGPLAYCTTCENCLKGELEYCLDYAEIGQKWPGGLAEYVAVPPECILSGNILALPEGLDVSHGAMVEPLSSCINAQEKGGGVTGKEVVIFGAGPIGCLHTALARANHAKKIFVVDHNPSRLNLAEEMGADYLIDNSQPNVGEQIRLLTQGKGADLAIIAAPSPDALLNGIQVAKKGGVILLFAGFPNDQAIFSVDFNLIHYQGLKIIGTTIFSPYHFQQSLDLISSKLIDIEKMITRYSLLDFSNAVQSAFERKIGKAILLP